VSDVAKVQRWYDARAEWQWGWTERNPVEYGVTLRTLREYLPPPPAAVLDAGGGPGTYAIALAEQGYRVTLFDLSAASLDLARQKAAERGVTLAGYVHGTATDLGAIAAGAFGAALALGPLYHLLALEERGRVRDELFRVAAPGAVVVAGFLSRFTPIRYGAFNHPERLDGFRRATSEFLENGVMLLSGDPSEPGGWVDAYCERPEAIAPFMEAGGFRTLDLVGAEGIFSMIQDRARAVPPESWPGFIELNFRLGREPSLLGAAEHLLYVGLRP
jgi:ubiquinone/menaquinone biosynthesis C-methylase UbiE